MRDALHSRYACMREIKEVAVGDHFLLTNTLLNALERLDLEQLNEVTDHLVEIAAVGIGTQRYARLRAERFGL